MVAALLRFFFWGGAFFLPLFRSFFSLRPQSSDQVGRGGKKKQKKIAALRIVLFFFFVGPFRRPTGRFRFRRPKKKSKMFFFASEWVGVGCFHNFQFHRIE